MKLPNGYGSVYKMGGNKRRRPWIARISSGMDYDEEKDKYTRKYKSIGYYKTKAEALNALAEYNANPYDVDANRVTLKELYEKWSENYFEKCAPSAKRTVVSAWSYCNALYRMRVKDIRVYHIENCINDAYIIPNIGKEKGKKRLATPSTKARMKSLFNLLFDYACIHEAADKNYARMFHLDEKIAEDRRKNKKPVVPFSPKEIQTLWENIQIPFVDMILIDIYSGWRPQELATLKIENIDLENNTMMGGLKTKAGKERIVPIHFAIRPLVERRYRIAKEIGSDDLFNDEEGQRGTHMTYDKYRGRFKKVMSRLHMESHRPHECRHTFITMAKKDLVDEYVLKLIVGHAISDITERVYTHRTIEQLKEEMNKISK
ncbi:MAG: site-specific integrase [Anaerostipes sp.]|nr:site-specific integrase [Anaerostipes sp.]